MSLRFVRQRVISFLFQSKFAFYFVVSHDVVLIGIAVTDNDSDAPGNATSVLAG